MTDALQTDVNVGSNSENARPKKRAGRRTVNSSDKGTEKYRKRCHRFGNSHHQQQRCMLRCMSSARMFNNNKSSDTASRTLAVFHFNADIRSGVIIATADPPD